MANEKRLKARDYLTKFGYSYAPEQVFQTLDTRSGLPPVEDRHIADGLRRFQALTGLPVTGRINRPTLAEMERTRCGFPDISAAGLMRLSLTAPRWDSPNITYGFSNFTQRLPVATIRQTVAAAFNLWTQAVPFQFREVSIDDNPKIVIRFARGSHGDNFSFDGPEHTLAHAFPPDRSLGGFAGDIHFDDDELWGIALSPSEKDLWSVAAHEIGHSLGLVHSDVRESLMYAIYEGPHRFLHPDDSAKIRQLYGA